MKLVISQLCLWKYHFQGNGGVSVLGPQLSFSLFIYLVLSVLGLCCCTLAFSNHGERGLLFIEAYRLLIVMTSLIAEHGP